LFKRISISNSLAKYQKNDDMFWIIKTHSIKISRITIAMFNLVKQMLCLKFNPRRNLSMTEFRLIKIVNFIIQ